MNKSPNNDSEREKIDSEAAEWVIMGDRGLTAPEKEAFTKWLAAEPNRWALISRHGSNWARLDRLVEMRPVTGAPDPNLLEAPRNHMSWALPLAMAAAAAIAVGVYTGWQHNASKVAEVLPHVGGSGMAERTLEDGSVVRLNGGSVVTIRYTPGERNVELDRGEAHFIVAKNPDRPFFVNAGGVRVRAVGTAFDVRLESSNVAIVVTEGRVQVDQSTLSRSPDHVSAENGGDSFVPQVPTLVAGQRAVLSLAPNSPPPQVTNLSSGEMNQFLSWQPRLLDFTSTPLADVIAEFNRRNAIQLKIADSTLAALRISASFRSDNVDGFVRLLESSFGVEAQQLSTGEIVLRKSSR